LQLSSCPGLKKGMKIDESLDALASSKFFSMLDLLSGYWQVPLSPDAQDKAAFKM